MRFLKQGTSVNSTALKDDTFGYKAHNFVCTEQVSFVANDSATNDLYLHFDAPVGQGGTIILKAGEILSDYPISCRELYVQGIGADVPFRAVGV